MASSIVSSIVRHALAAGLDLATLSLRFDLPVDVLALDEVVVLAEVPDELLREVARVAREPDVAVRVGSSMRGRRTSDTCARCSARAISRSAAPTAVCASGRTTWPARCVTPTLERWTPSLPWSRPGSYGSPRVLRSPGV
jgi:hypothetical protein